MSLELELSNRVCKLCYHTGFKKYGSETEGKQRIICLGCGTRPILNALKKGERTFDQNKLLPILQKQSHELNNGELYCLGLLVSDGCFTNNNTIKLGVDVKDIELLDIVKQELCIPGSIREYSRSKTFNENKYIEHSATISWQYKYSQEYWQILGLFSQKTGNEVWLDYMNSPSFIRGLLDGDGCFYSNGLQSRLSIVMGSLNFLECLQKYLENSLAISKQVPHYSNKGKTALALRYRIKEVIKIGDFIYQDSKGLRLERKYNKFLEIKSYALAINGGPRKRANSSSQYRGVDQIKTSGLWRVRIRLDSGRQELIGLFTTELEAAQAYNKRAIELNRPFLNNV